MEKFDVFRGIKSIHFVGIGGISMSALAKLVLNRGIAVSGSDIKKTNIIFELENLGAKVFIGHNAKNIDNADIVVFTSAVQENNVEVIEAKKLGILVYERADFLYLIALNYNNVIAISGTHGKTTACGMLASIFIAANKNPTVHIGGECSCTQGNLKIGDKNFFISEVCEYQRHLLKMPHNVGVILNIEYDHPDYYKNLAEVGDAFSEFSNISKELTVIEEKYSIFMKKINKKTFRTFSISGNGDYVAKNIRQYVKGVIKFDCYKYGNFFGSFCINAFGKFNVNNALASIVVADYYNIPTNDIFNGLKNFCGVKRRYEFMGKINNCPVIHDYAHHPTQIENVIKSTKEIFKKPVVCVFQPHTYSRTIKLFTQFVNAFSLADKLILFPTYPAREKPIKNASAKSLFNAINFKFKNSNYLTSYKSVLKHLSKLENCVILILGAGDIVDLAETIKSNSNFNKFCN